MNSLLILVFVSGILVVFTTASDEVDTHKHNLNHPKNLGWKAPEGHREKRYGGWGGGYPGMYGGGYGGGYPGYGGGYRGGYPMGGGYGSSSWGSYSSSSSGGYSSYNSGYWGR
ncbi:hypothetical protein CAEBREN_30251 [Caenorhabditis brenneri]|uniref:Uncharacterized protein n=1 Tax=Caenorhabditis brenneri TaxID=135651 RepID=G0NAW8_CAEBE|nr:hypothetical protein CAEBREN_30251 [Caenorhabditis brenneri]